MVGEFSGIVSFGHLAEIVLDLMRTGCVGVGEKNWSSGLEGSTAGDRDFGYRDGVAEGQEKLSRGVGVDFRRGRRKKLLRG